MKVRSKLADIDFIFGKFQYKKDHLIVHSDSERSMESKVYVSPDDILSGFSKALSNPMVWIYFLGFPIFLIRYRRRHRRKCYNRN